MIRHASAVQGGGYEAFIQEHGSRQSRLAVAAVCLLRALLSHKATLDGIQSNILMIADKHCIIVDQIA